MLVRPEVLRLAATAAVAFVVLWQKLLVPVLLGLLVYAWSCLLADRLSRRFGAGRSLHRLGAYPGGPAGASRDRGILAAGSGPLSTPST